jgi:hypothetical protein
MLGDEIVAPAFTADGSLHFTTLSIRTKTSRLPSIHHVAAKNSKNPLRTYALTWSGAVAVM